MALCGHVDDRHIVVACAVIDTIELLGLLGIKKRWLLCECSSAL
jgi:hypothetical protein